MTDWEQRLFAIERELAGGDGETYGRHLREDAVVIVPGESLDREGTIAAIDRAGGWDAFEITDQRAVQLGEDAALLTYRFGGARGDFHYAATLSSAYVRGRDGEWKLAFHQQTPL